MTPVNMGAKKEQLVLPCKPSLKFIMQIRKIRRGNSGSSNLNTTIHKALNKALLS